MHLNRVIYLGYYIKELDYKTFILFLKHTSCKSQKSKLLLVLDAVKSVFTYNISLLEYFQFNFFKLSNEEKNKWAGTGYMYEYQLEMNPKKNRDILENKVSFFNHFREQIGRNYATMDELVKQKKSINDFKHSNSRKIVLKQSKGGCGKGVNIIDVDSLSQEQLLLKMRQTKNDLAEGFVKQHDLMNRLSPSGLNTIRVITQIDQNGAVDIIGARLRISVNSIVDNMAAGNLAAGINSKSGIVFTKGFYSDITRKPVKYHPSTKESIIGFQIPFWDEIIELTKRAAKSISTLNKSVGWDVGITNNGPVLIEGNHDWCKLVWQLPVQKGLKFKLDKYGQ